MTLTTYYLREGRKEGGRREGGRKEGGRKEGGKGGRERKEELFQ